MASPTQLAIPSAGGIGSKDIPRLTTSCSDCGEPIPLKRLAVFPHAKFCVPCQSNKDILVKRYDEFSNGEVVSTLFTRNKRIEDQMRRVNTMAAPDAAFEVAVGDDSHLIREESEPDNDHAYHVSEAWESEEEEVETPEVPAQALAATA